MNFLDKYQNKILIGIWSAIFLTCFFVIFSEPVHASTGSSTTLPYSCAEYWDYNTALHNNFDVALAWARARYENIDHVPEGYSILVWTTDGIYTDWAGRKGTQYSFMVNPYTSYNYSENMDYSSNTVNLATVYPIYNFYYIDAGTYSSNNGGYSAVLLGNSASVDTEFGVYLPRYPFYYDGEPVLDSDGTEIIVSRIETSPSLVTGHATEPINDPDNIITDSNNNPISRPIKPTPSVFNPPTWSPPSIDTSSLEKLVESLIDVVDYGFTYLGGLISGTFGNLLSNLGAWVDYIVASFEYGFNNVVKAIQNLATDFYNNMVSLFEPLYDFLSGVGSFFNHLIEIGTVDGSFALANIVTYLFIPDSATLYPIFVDHDEFNIIGISNHVFNEYRLFMSRVESINTLHYILIPSFTFHGQTVPQTRIDFEWFSDYKVYTDGIISAFLIVGYIYFLFTRIGGWLRGNQGDVYVGDNSSNYHGTKIGF